MTSLSLSLYLTNVQRQNCSNPFPNSPLEKRQSVGKNKVSSAVVAKCSNTLVSSCNREVSSEPESSCLKVEKTEDKFGSEFQSDQFDLSSESVEEIDFDAGASESKEEDESEKNQDSKKADMTVGIGNDGGADMSNQLGSIDSRLAGILQNLHNLGNITINFHFDSHKK